MKRPNLLGEFAFAIGFSLLCLIGSFIYGVTNHGMDLALEFVLITLILGIMELSLSFDNAVVNATVLQKMTPIWQHRFLTWGILIAVFGMRFLFPLLIVAVVAGMGFAEVVTLAFNDPETYSERLTEAHVSISAFGGSFLMLVFLSYFLDPDKGVHWLGKFEEWLGKLGSVQAVQIFLTGIFLLLAVHYLVPTEEQFAGLMSGVIGILVYILVKGLSNLFEAEEAAVMGEVARGGFLSFLYLEVLDASFSLDGVIGAFAITKEIVVISLGLAIGAVFVRSFTLLMVHQGTLQTYRFLEHGAHYGIGSLALIMLLSLSPNIEIPELVTGLIGVFFIGLAVGWSMRYNRLEGSKQAQ